MPRSPAENWVETEPKPFEVFVRNSHLKALWPNFEAADPTVVQPRSQILGRQPQPLGREGVPLQLLPIALGILVEVRVIGFDTPTEVRNVPYPFRVSPAHYGLPQSANIIAV